MIGGRGSIPGAVGGAVVVDGVRNAAATVSGFSLAFLGGMIVLVVVSFPGGLKALLRPRATVGDVCGSDITGSNGAMRVTVNGQKLDITVRGGNGHGNGAQVITADVMASNGVIHVINGVLMPKPEPAMSGR